MGKFSRYFRLELGYSTSFMSSGNVYVVIPSFGKITKYKKYSHMLSNSLKIDFIKLKIPLIKSVSIFTSLVQEVGKKSMLYQWVILFGRT